MIPAIEHLARIRPDYSGVMRFMKILARGHNKSSEQAWITSWLLMASQRRIEGYILAADRDQGRLIIKAARDFLELNPWIPVEIQRDRLIGPRGEVEVLPFDAKSGMGLRGNYFILDEVVHWKRQDEWTGIITGLRKVKPCLLCVMSNAGLLDSWQHEAYKAALRAPRTWNVFHREGTLASWLDRKGLAEDRELLPPSEAERLLDNRWIDPAAEHDYLRRSEVNACAALGDAMGLSIRMKASVVPPISNYVAVIDYGPRRDRTALGIMHADEAKRTIVDRLDVWQGSDGKPVLVSDVEEWIERTNRDFAPRVFLIDPYQMEGTIQWAQKKGIPVEAFKFRSGAGNYELAQHLRAQIVGKRLIWYPGAGKLNDTLEDELTGLRVKRMPYGYRFDHETQKHDDRAFVLAAGSLRAVQYPAESARIVMPPPLAFRT